jgi:hypothetical protein
VHQGRGGPLDAPKGFLVAIQGENREAESRCGQAVATVATGQIQDRSQASRLYE